MMMMIIIILFTRTNHNHDEKDDNDTSDENVDSGKHDDEYVSSRPRRQARIPNSSATR